MSKNTFNVILILLLVAMSSVLYAKDDIREIIEPNVSVGPLLSTIWSQGAPYNNMCPEQGGIHMVTGPTALAYAQIMNYYQWPPVGDDFWAIEWDGDICQGGLPEPTMIVVDFDTWYDWDNMPQYCVGGTCGPTADAAVSRLLLDVGVAFDTDFNGVCAGSGANPYLGINKLPNFFKYKNCILPRERQGTSNNTWYNYIKTEIDQGRPVIYHLLGDVRVCDGYRDEFGEKYVHFNPGGWVVLSSTSPFPYDQEYILTGIQPDSSAMGPCWIPEHIYVDHASGSDTFGSGSELSPYRTIGKAILESEDCDTIWVKPGVYTESITIDTKNIAIISTDGPEFTTITNGDNDNLVTFVNIASSETTLQGFHLEGGWMGIWCKNSGPTIKYNVLHNQHVNNWASVVFSGSYYGSLGTSPAIFINNTVDSCVNGGISNFSTAAPTIKNNIVVTNEYGFHQDGGAAAPILGYNDVWQNPTWYIEPGAFYVSKNYIGNVDSVYTGAISVDPMLTADQGLAYGSPCIDAGDPNPIYNDPDGSRCDLGGRPGIDYPDPIHVFAGDSIQLAVDTAQSGQTVIVHPGTWTESVWFKGKVIRLISSDGPEQTHLIAGGWGYAVEMTNNEEVGCLVDGFTITSPYGFMSDIRVGVGASAVIQNCIFRDKPDGTILHEANISVAGSGTGEVLITRNLFYNNDCYGSVKVLGGGTYDVEIINNTFDNNVFGVNSLRNNTVFKNNIVTNCSDFGVAGTYGELDYNDIWNNTVNYSGPAAGAHDISANPLYVDAAEGDYRLLLFSPCIDAGDPAPEYDDPDGSDNDMGAFIGGVRLILPPPILPKSTGAVPEEFALFQNFPNPFNPETEIRFSLPEAGHVRLEVFNILGQEVATLVDEYCEAGTQSVVWNGHSNSGSEVASGIYLYRLTTDKYVKTMKMNLLK